VRLTRLYVENLGLFRGGHEFTFSSNIDGGKRLTIVSGHNGAGKTTLYRSVPLALHGALALGDRVSRSGYETYLYNLLHRESQDGVTTVSANARIDVSAEYVRSGQPVELRVVRAIQRSGSRATDQLNVTVDGEEPDVEDPQAWLRDVIPETILPICFFDAEALGSMLGADGQSARLAESVHRILGLHLLERLDADLALYLSKVGAAEADSLRTDLLSAQQLLIQHVDSIRAAEDELRDLTSSKQLLLRELQQIEKKLVAEGGSFAEKRPLLQAEAKRLESEVQELERQLREEAEGLLPFAFAPQMLSRLSKRLSSEDNVRHQKVLDKVWREQRKVLLRAVADQQFWEGLTGVPSPVREEISKRLDEELGRYIVPGSPEDVVHDLSSSELQQVLVWIERVSGKYPTEVTKRGHDLKSRRTRLERVLRELSRAPEDDLLKDMHTEIQVLKQSIHELEVKEVELVRAKSDLEVQATVYERAFDRARKQFEESRAADHGSSLAIRSQSVVRVYRDELVMKRLEAIQLELVSSFNWVCRKDHLLEKVEIDPGTFETTLRGRDGHPLLLDDFSAGERQLYNLAMVRALRVVSGFSLPLFVDTPFARLDESHRERLVKHFFPAASDQIVLFMTDAERNALGETAANEMSHQYILESSEMEGQSKVERRPAIENPIRWPESERVVGHGA
jgi:DNA sulfur modification protein DndD